MKNLMKLSAGALSAVIAVSSPAVNAVPNPVPVNNGVFIVEVPSGIPFETVGVTTAPETVPAVTALPETSPDASKSTPATLKSTPETTPAPKPPVNSLPKHIDNTYAAKKNIGDLSVHNRTDISDELLKKESDKPFRLNAQKNGEPQVLIYHSHTSESFLESSKLNDSGVWVFRNTDEAKNITSAGEAIARQIEAAGYGVIHDKTSHDDPLYKGAYVRSAETVKAILDEYPSIKIILDVHRDAIEENEIPVAAVTEINGREAAQIMLISPADDGNWNVPDYMDNFRFAGRLQRQMNADSPGLSRSILFQYCNYNLNLSPNALLVEIGSHGNTLQQAVYAGELLGKSIVGILEND